VITKDQADRNRRAGRRQWFDAKYAAIRARRAIAVASSPAMRRPERTVAARGGTDAGKPGFRRTASMAESIDTRGWAMTLTGKGREVAREILSHLRTSREPVREDVLHERMATDVSPERFLGVLEQLLAQGKVGMHADHESPVNAPPPAEPFGLRYWYPTPG